MGGERGRAEHLQAFPPRTGLGFGVAQIREGLVGSEDPSPEASPGLFPGVFLGLQLRCCLVPRGNQEVTLGDLGIPSGQQSTWPDGEGAVSMLLTTWGTSLFWSLLHQTFFLTTFLQSQAAAETMGFIISWLSQLLRPYTLMLWGAFLQPVFSRISAQAALLLFTFLRCCQQPLF